MNLWPRWYSINGETREKDGCLSVGTQAAQSIFPSLHLWLGTANDISLKQLESSERKKMMRDTFLPAVDRKWLRRIPHFPRNLNISTYHTHTTGSETHFTAVYQNITSCCSCLTVKLFYALICMFKPCQIIYSFFLYKTGLSSFPSSPTKHSYLK